MGLVGWAVLEQLQHVHSWAVRSHSWHRVPAVWPQWWPSVGLGVPAPGGTPGITLVCIGWEGGGHSTGLVTAMGWWSPHGAGDIGVGVTLWGQWLHLGWWSPHGAVDCTGVMVTPWCWWHWGRSHPVGLLTALGWCSPCGAVDIGVGATPCCCWLHWWWCSPHVDSDCIGVMVTSWGSH